MMATVFAACGGGSAPAPSAPAGDGGGAASAPEEPSVAPGAKGSIEFWTVFTGADGKSMQTIVDEFNATNPDYTVNHRAIEANDLYLKMPLAVQSGQDIPELVINHVERLRIFKDNDFLTDLTPFLSQAGIQASNYNEKSWNMGNIDGGHYSVPLDIHTFLLYVNMDLYEQYGAGEMDDDILTWDEIMAAGERLEGTGIMPFGFTWLRVKFLAAYAQLGGKLSSDGQTPDFNNDMAKRVLEQWIAVKDAGYSTSEGDAPWEVFQAGNMLFCPEGQWMYNHVRESGLNAKMFDYVVFDPAIKGNWTSSHQFVVPVDTKRDDDRTIAALKFVDYIGNNGIEWAKAGQLPAQTSIKNNPEFQGMPQAFLADQNEELKIYDYKYYGYAVEALDKVLPEMLWGRMSIEDGLGQAVQETKDRIELEG